MAEIKSYVYVITCIPTSCVYVGKSNNPQARFKSHLQNAKKKSEYLPLYRAIRKYGADNFKLSILQECASEQEAYDIERDTILKFRTEGISLFNRSAGGIGNFSPTPDTRKRMSEAQKGKIITEDQRKRISETLTGRKCDPEVVEKIKSKLKGQKRTGLALENIKAAAKARSQNPQWIEKNKAALRENAKLSRTPECRKRISETQRKFTNEIALEAKEMYKNGVSLGVILEKFSVGVGTLYRMLEHASVLSGEPLEHRHHKKKS